MGAASKEIVLLGSSHRNFCSGTSGENFPFLLQRYNALISWSFFGSEYFLQSRHLLSVDWASAAELGTDLLWEGDYNEDILERVFDF